MIKRYTLGYSPCPNDTFIFYALVHKKIDCAGVAGVAGVDGGIDFVEHIEDVETLNQMALEGRLDITKVSAAAYGHIKDGYELLRNGGAAGWGCGPLLVSKERLPKLRGKRLAIPGLMTTAYVLASLYDCHLRENVIVMPFDKIIPAIRDGIADCGLVIHEGRFTYKDYGLNLVEDLGAWWEQTTGLPVPLGVIAAKSTIPPHTRTLIDNAIKASISYAYANTNETMDYVRRYSQELSDEVITNHIKLYVNDYTTDSGISGSEGRRAIDTLLDMARQKGIMQANI
ncbi:1,4-dihydroxy-6-naphthoate synthase [Candidatus Magnetominusculus xianensis]|uniref:1,4-dihydroxy-6-naphtoate synthase n=1 Tax=Candidatus Magnetominusculus xianensis TaxID=1748249 RepID=A0ABR5SHM0_9BACT|nr:1,4-dihydroxy-6-naphthoate synthase [Candidatus Magnetominusculus xianensis]KWT91668.1 1,4-dihydroxy-6-naphthoate synthase [Candidatus Magnetominusculus xianensis]MBF0404575.1 1,4-dihydroxy-6-naphthoate synthase [Nitrospirota bacterium]